MEMKKQRETALNFVTNRLEFLNECIESLFSN